MQPLTSSSAVRPVYVATNVARLVTHAVSLCCRCCCCCCTSREGQTSEPSHMPPTAVHRCRAVVWSNGKFDHFPAGVLQKQCGRWHFTSTALHHWRVPSGEWRAVPKRCMTTDAGEGMVLRHASRQGWYRRQLRDRTLFPLDLVPLALRTHALSTIPPSCSARKKEKERRAAGCAEAMSDAFLSCCGTSLCDTATLLFVFGQLSPDQQCAILCRLTTQEPSNGVGGLAALAGEALRTARLTAAHWQRVFQAAVRDCTSLSNTVDSLPVLAILQTVLSSGPSAFSTPDDSRDFLAAALRLAERSGTPRATIAAALKQCGLTFEACAYACTASSHVPDPLCSTGELDGIGYGPLVRSMCALPHPPLAWFRRVRASMPPPLQHYATLTLLHAFLKRQGGISSADTTLWRGFTADIMSPLEAASAMHFVLGEGSAFTARLLLQHCHTKGQLLTLMRYTRNAGHDLAFQALERLVTLCSGHERVLVHLRFRDRTRLTTVALLFHAQRAGVGELFRRPKRSGEPDAAAAAPLALGLTSADRGALRRQLRDALPRGVVARGERSLSQLLAALPSSAVDHVAASLPTMHADALSWWVALYLRGHNADGAFAVLRVIAARGCLPHMEVLVELLEATQDDQPVFVEAVSIIQREFGKVADTVLRAFVERAAAQVASAPAHTGATAQAVHALKALAVLGLPPHSARCLRNMTATAPTDAMDATVRLAAELSRTSGGEALGGGVMPLDVSALRGLATAGAQLRYDVGVSVIALNDGGGFEGWWGSAARSRQSLTHHAYASAELSLWQWVRQEALSPEATLTCSELHKALRVVALGSGDGKLAASLWHSMRDRLLRPAAGRSNTGGRSRRTRAAEQSERRMECTLACIYAVCLSSGNAHLARSVLRSAGPVTSPLLAALAATGEQPNRNHQSFPSPSDGSAMHRQHPQALSWQAPSTDIICTRSFRLRPRGGTRVLEQLPPSLQRLVAGAAPEVREVLQGPHLSLATRRPTERRQRTKTSL